MSDTAPDEVKRKRGVLWYSVAGVAVLAVYVVSFAPVVVVTERLIDNGILTERMGSVVGVPYFPVKTLIGAFGLEDVFVTILETLMRVTP